MNEDWEKPTILRKGRISSKDARSTAAINKAMTTGNAEIHKKMSAGANKQHSAPSRSMAKIEQESDQYKVDTVDKSVSRAIIEGRQKKNLTQKELANLINERIQVVQEYEQGKAIPSQQILGKMEKTLGIRLRGVRIGEPF